MTPHTTTHTTTQLRANTTARLQATETPDSVIYTYDNGEYSVTGLASDNGSGGISFNVNVTVADSQQ